MKISPFGVEIATDILDFYPAHWRPRVALAPRPLLCFAKRADISMVQPV